MSIFQLNNPEYYSSKSKKIIDFIIGFFIGLVINVLVLVGIVNFILPIYATATFRSYFISILCIIDGLLVFLSFYFKRKYFGIGYIILLLLLAIVIYVLLHLIAGAIYERTF